MRRKLSTVRSVEEMLVELEKNPGSASAGDVLQICALYRAAIRTVQAQREVIDRHVRAITEFKKKK